MACSLERSVRVLLKTGVPADREGFQFGCGVNAAGCSVAIETVLIYHLRHAEQNKRHSKGMAVCNRHPSVGSKFGSLEGAASNVGNGVADRYRCCKSGSDIFLSYVALTSIPIRLLIL